MYTYSYSEAKLKFPNIFYLARGTGGENANGFLVSKERVSC